MPKLSSTSDDTSSRPVDAGSYNAGIQPDQADTLPWWVSTIDILLLLLVALTVRAMVGTGTRITLAEDVRLSFTSWPRLLAWTGGLLIVRHFVRRTPPWHSRVAVWARALWRAEAVQAAWPPYLSSRLLVLAVAYVAVVMIGFKEPLARRSIPHDVLDLFARFDAGWYFAIARFGYSHRGAFTTEEQHPIAFFPGLPMLMRGVGRVLDVNLWVAGILIVVVAFFVGLVCLYRLAREDLSADEAKASLLFLAFYPFAVCYSAVLTEALFLLIVSVLFLYFRRGRPARVAPLALFVGLLRPNGFLLSIPLALTALIPFARARGWLPGGAEEKYVRWRPLLIALSVAALPALGTLGYCVYAKSLTGDPFAWMKAQQAWGRSSAGILDFIKARHELIVAFGWSAYPRLYPVEIFEACAALFALASVWPITRRFGLPYGLFVAMSVLPPFITMGSVSLGRYTAPLFPIFLWLGAAVRPERRIYWIAAFAMGQALVATLFFTGRPPY